MNKKITKEVLKQDNYKYKGFYGYSEIWVNDKQGLLLDKIKENENVYKVRFQYSNTP